jgi:hypothetical protein
MGLSRTARQRIGIALGIVLLYGTVWFLFHTTGRRTEGPIGVVGAVGLAPSTLARPSPSPAPTPSPDPLADYRVTSYRIEDSGTVDAPSPGRTTSTPASPTCKNRSFSIIGESPVGDAWRFTASVNWCYTTGGDRHLTSASFGQSGVTYLPLWNYEGVAGDIRTGCVGPGCHWRYRRVTGHFSFCLVPFGCTHDYPYIAFTVRDDGTSTLGWGG